jgi:hypothetical protein
MTAARLEQRRRAMKRANQVRCGRAQLKTMVRSGRMHLGDVLKQPPAIARTMLTEQLLACGPFLGERKTERIMRRAGVRHLVPIGELTERERSAILATVRVEYPVMWAAWERAGSL